MSVVVALAMVLVAGQPAAGYQVVSETGLVGTYTFVESEASPRARCGYSSVSDDAQYLRFMRLGPPTVYAADRNSEKRDTRIVGWRFLIQKDVVEQGWTTVARSPIQKARAYEDTAAAFTAMKVKHSTSQMALYRALVVIIWYRADGSVEGRAKLTPDWYQFKDPSGTTFTLGESFCPGVFRIL